MTTRRGLAALGVAAAFAVGGTATAATAKNDPGAGKSNAPGQANRCERLDHAITVLDERVQTRLENRIARVQAKIASGDLTEKQLERAKKFLAHLENRLEKLEALIDRLEAKFAEKCPSTTTG
jgi:hypothetical protein